MPPIIVHIGFPKCASTLLQRHVFPKISGINYISMADGSEFYQALAWKHPPGGEAARARTLDKLKQLADASGVPTLVSVEHFVMPGDCLDSSFAKTPTPLLDSADILSLVKKHFGAQARILLFIRRQQDWLQSWYQERIKHYETRTFDEMLRSSDFQAILELLEYDRVIEELISRFGAANVRVLPFELFKTDTATLFREIARFLGATIPESPLPVVRGSMQAQTIFARRITNKALVALSRLTGGGTMLDSACFGILKKIYAYDFLLKPLANKPAPGEIPSVRLRSYSKSNRLAEKYVKYDLKALGYL